jgi:putative endonuclease
MDDKKYWVYIVASNSGTLYIGVMSKLAFRVMQHKSGEIEGFSSKYKCNRLVYFESFDIVQKAIGREKQLKGWRRSKKIALIESLNPTVGRPSGEVGLGDGIRRQVITGR